MFGFEVGMVFIWFRSLGLVCVFVWNLGLGFVFGLGWIPGFVFGMVCVWLRFGFWFGVLD